MLELIRFLLETAGQIMPCRLVWSWQQGLVYFCGRYQYTTGPGIKLIIPFLMDVRTISIVPEICTTPLQTITLRPDKDGNAGKTLTYSASLTVVVIDADAAYNRVGHHTETLIELAGRVVSERLADADPDRFDPSYKKRANLIEEIRGAVNETAKPYGMEVTALGLNNFALGVRTIRLLLDKAVLTEGNHAAGV